MKNKQGKSVVDMLRNGESFADGFKYGNLLRGRGHIEVYRASGRVFVCVCYTGVFEVTGKAASIVKALLHAPQSSTLINEGGHNV